MQLKIQRSQRKGLAGKVLFCVDLRADYSQEERANINRYGLGGQTIYNSKNAERHLVQAGTHLDQTQSGSLGHIAGGLARGAFSLALAKMSLNITIASLGRGHHIECKDLPEMLEAESTVRTACKDLTRYLEAAATFDGSETIVEYVNGEERLHIAQSAPPLLEYTDNPSSAPADADRPKQHNNGKSPPRMGPADPDGFEYAYGNLHLTELFEPIWQAFEAKMIALAQAYGFTVSSVTVRLGTAAAALLLLSILIKIL